VRSIASRSTPNTMTRTANIGSDDAVEKLASRNRWCDLWFPWIGKEVVEICVTDYWRIKEMTREGVIDRLIEMGRNWVKTPT
jgi:hypothetical protein